jgi:hypothetical protein
VDLQRSLITVLVGTSVRAAAGALAGDDDGRPRDPASRCGGTGSPIGRLRTAKGHPIDPAHVAYHRERFGP